MMRRSLWSALSCVLLACGGQIINVACGQADELAQQMQQNATQDGISSTALCLKTESELAPSVGAERAAKYVADCKRLRELLGQCHGG